MFSRSDRAIKASFQDAPSRVGKQLMAGLLTRGSVLHHPSQPIGQWIMASLTAYSCGGSHGFDADWRLTVFPFHPQRAAWRTIISEP